MRKIALLLEGSWAAGRLNHGASQVCRRAWERAIPHLIKVDDVLMARAIDDVRLAPVLHRCSLIEHQGVGVIDGSIGGCEAGTDVAHLEGGAPSYSP